MKLIPLIDRNGTARAWADRNSGLICNPTGNVFALIEFDGVFRLTGIKLAGGSTIMCENVAGELLWLDRAQR